MPSHQVDWSAYRGAQKALSARRRCDDASWGLEAELDRIVASEPIGSLHAANETGRRGACRRRGLMVAEADRAAEDFALHVAGGWERPVIARLELDRLVRTANSPELVLIRDVAFDDGSAKSSAFRKRLQRLRSRSRAA